MQANELLGSAYLFASSVPPRKRKDVLNMIASTMRSVNIKPIAREITRTVVSDSKLPQLSAAMNKYLPQSVQTSVKRAMLPPQTGRPKQYGGALTTVAAIGVLLSYVTLLRDVANDAIVNSYKYVEMSSNIRGVDFQKASRIMIELFKNLEISGPSLPRIEGSVELIPSFSMSNDYPTTSSIVGVIFALMIMVFLIIQRIQSTQSKQQQIEAIVAQQPRISLIQQQKKQQRSQPQQKKQQRSQPQQKKKPQSQTKQQQQLSIQQLEREISKLKAQLGVTA